MARKFYRRICCGCPKEFTTTHKNLNFHSVLCMRNYFENKRLQDQFQTRLNENNEPIFNFGEAHEIATARIAS